MQHISLYVGKDKTRAKIDQMLDLHLPCDQKYASKWMIIFAGYGNKQMFTTKFTIAI